MARADTEEEVGLAEEGEAEGFVVDSFGKLVFPGEDIGYAEAGPFGLGLEEGVLLLQRDMALFIPFRSKIV